MSEKYLGIKCSFCMHRNHCPKENINEIKQCRDFSYNNINQGFLNELSERMLEETNDLEFEFRQSEGDGIYID